MPISHDTFNAPAFTPNVSAPKVPIRAQTYTFQYEGCSEAQEHTFDTREKPAAEQKLETKLAFKFVLLLPGADAAQSKFENLPVGAERDALFEAFKTKYLDKGQGRFFWLNCTKTLSDGSNGKKVSNAYTLACGLLNEGDVLTADQRKNLATLLNALETESPKPQFFGAVSKTGEKNKLTSISGRVPEDELLPSYRRLGRAVDPREADDEEIYCEVTNDRIFGYVSKFGNNVGQWVTAREAADHSKTKYGKVLCGSEIRKRKVAAQATSPSGASAESLPF